jgi:DNA modification methylase
MNFYKHAVVPVEALIPYALNSRTHSDAQVAQLAASIREFGFTNPILVDEQSNLIAGHGRLLAARKLGLTEVPAVVVTGLDDRKRRALIIADNKLALNAGWDEEALRVEMEDLGADYGELMGFSQEELSDILNAGEPTEGLTDEDEVPEVPSEPVTKLGDVWLLGKHRVMCGDSTSIDAVEKLMVGKKAQLLHADPPYGMGKASDGVANDNIYEEDLDKFQMEWWATFRTFLTDNASAYIWGNAPDLWRLWYRGGLGDSEKLELRNQIVWDKKNIPGMKSDLMTQYPVTTEHCLFFQLGEQFRGNINTEDFPEDWAPVQSYMAGEASAADITAQDVKRVCGVGMFSHWFTKSQFTLVPEKHYQTLASEYPGCFARPWKDINREWDKVKKSGPTSVIQEARSYFDNAHDIMRDVWEFNRVTGDERHGHATPKPVAMMERVMKSSLPKGSLCVEPFGGSGATLMGAEKAGRVCFAMELQPKYVDVIVKRWQDFTGKQAVLESSGETYDTLAKEEA